MCLHEIIARELLEQKSLAALLFLIEKGRELEFTIDGSTYFLSAQNAEKGVSLCQNQSEQRFEDVETMLENAVISGKPFLSLWNEAQIVTLF